MSMFRFAHPFFLPILLLFLLGAVYFVCLRRTRRGVVFSAFVNLPPKRSTWRKLLLDVLPLMYLAGLALCVVAMARPQALFDRSARRADAIAIQMVVDVSGSMEALDFSTRDVLKTRLDMVKETFADFVQQRPDDLLGLVTFGGYATSRVPLTLDHEMLLHVLKGVAIPRPSLDAAGQLTSSEELLTAIGDGLATALARVEKAPVASRVIVLLSDGESNAGIIKPGDAARAAKALGVKIYTIGVGSTGLVPFMVRDAWGRQTIRRGEVALDEAQLKEIAETTGGLYFNVLDSSGMQKAMRAINQLERTEVRREVYRQYREYYAWFLGGGLLLIALAVFLNVLLGRKVI